MHSAFRHSNLGAIERALDVHPDFLLAARDLYSSDVKWSAPARGAEHIGREDVIRCLLREASGMHDPEFTFLRRNLTERQIIDEFAVRFVYVGAGFENAPADAGDLVELKRVRILALDSGKVVSETCVENWTILAPRAAG